MTRTFRLTLVALVVLCLSGSVPVAPGLMVEPATAEVNLPTMCLLYSANHGACTNCCKTLADLPATICSRFCRTPIPPPPAPEPQP